MKIQYDFDEKFLSWVKEKGLTEEWSFPLIYEAYCYGADYWVNGVDMWLAEGQKNPIPPTWEEAKQTAINSGQDWNAEDGRGIVYLALALREAAERCEGGAGETAQEWLDLLDMAQMQGSFDGWVEALRIQEARG